MRGRKLRWVLALAALVVAVLVAALPVVLAPQPKQPSTITLESWDEILARNYAKGITRSEVEAILGPAGDYRTRHSDNPFHDGIDPVTGNFHSHNTCWVCDTLIIAIVFDDTGHAINMCMDDIRPSDAGTVDNLLWRAKRQWHRWFP
jgi:hypothetical protein